MQIENLYYAITQFVHNFGALAIVGGAIAGLKVACDNHTLKRKLAWLVLLGWGAQAFSGAVFGAITVHFYGETPDLHTTAYVALIVKIACVISGIALALLYLKRASNLNEAAVRRIWFTLTLLGSVALTAAAFLRWFS